MSPLGLAVGLGHGLVLPVNPVAQLRANYTDTALPAVWSRDGVHLSGAGTVACADDARCSTSTGRILIPRTTGSYVDLGNQAATLDALGKITIIARLTPQTLGIAATIVARSQNTATGTSPFAFRIVGGNVLSFFAWDGAAQQVSNGAGAVVAGTDIYVVVVFDGTQAGAARCRMDWKASSTIVGTPIALANGSNASVPATLLAPSSGTTNLTVGADATGANALQAPLDTVGVYIGQALTNATIASEIAAGLSGAHHRYTFDGTVNDSGATGGWNGAVQGTGLAYCSDDTRWGPILFSGAGAASPTWDAVNREGVFDGTAQYMKAIGGAIGNISGDMALALVVTFPTPTAAEQRMIEVADVSGATSVFILNEGTPAGNVGAEANLNGPVVPPPSAYSNYPGARVLFGRRTKIDASNTRVGTQVGRNAEASLSVAATDVVPGSLVLGAGRGAGGSFAGIRFRGLIAYKGDFAGKQFLAQAWVQSLGASL